MSVFVQLVSYKNFDLLPTIKDCIQNAKDKENLYFGICLQQDEETPKELDHPRIKAIRVPLNESLGHGWARNKAQSLYEGQDFTLQVGTGSRFAQNWDEELISAMSQVGSPKPIITNYANKYNSSNQTKEYPEVAYKVQIHQYANDLFSIWPNPMKNIKNFNKSRWISDHYYFAKGEHCKEVIHDPNYYYSEVEIALTLRSFTFGYDFFNHFKPLVWRDYSIRPQNWQDDSGWWHKDIASKQRFRDLRNEKISDYPLGKVRSLKDFEIYSGINFANQKLQKATVTANEPPCLYQNEDQWKKDFVKDYTLTVNWNTEAIEKCEDYDYWYFAIEDKDGAVINRQDIRPDREKDIIDFKVNWKRVTFKSFEDKIPSKFSIHPVSKSKGWLKKVTFDI